MRALLLAIFMLSFAYHSRADNWVCPNPEDEFCDSYHAEFIANQAHKRMNEVYKKLLSDYPTKKEQQPTIIAQRAWLRYADAHCAAILSKFAGATFTKAKMEYDCKSEQINKRIDELKSYCESCGK